MKNTQLFKDSITLTNYKTLIKELSNALDEGAVSLKQLLFGTEVLDLYENHGKYKVGQHKYCAGLNGSSYTEKRLCKCMYYLSNNHEKNCEKCDFMERFEVVGEYSITDYEVPAFYYGDGIGKIDLIISKDNVEYATEVKPYKGNNETLLRMIAEIMTYTEGDSMGKYKKAIAFFEKNRDDGNKTIQQKEYETVNPDLLDLIKKADITVFRFEEVDEKVYQICKL